MYYLFIYYGNCTHGTMTKKEKYVHHAQNHKMTISSIAEHMQALKNVCVSKPKYKNMESRL